jgi:hypothetical protein
MIKVAEYEKIKSEYCDKVQGLIQKLESLRKEEKDTIEICRQLETTLKEFFLLRREVKK